MLETVFGIEPLSFGVDVGREGEFLGGGIPFAPGHNGPGSEVALLGHERTDPDDLAVLDVNRNGTGIGTAGKNLFRHINSSSGKAEGPQRLSSPSLKKIYHKSTIKQSGAQ